MTPRSSLISPAMSDYVLAHTEPPDEVMAALIAETAGMPEVSMQIAPDQAAFMALLVRSLNARRAIEIGTFTGLSALAVARALPEGGSLLCCDLNAEWTAIGRGYWEQAGVSDRIELRIGPAAQTLEALPAEPTYDFAFVDADKTGYAGYVDALYPRMQTNALILLDNTLRSGRVLGGSETSADDDAMIALNDQLISDGRWETVLLPIADGLTLLRKR
ncbi:MAG: class I SAM-dependent methyltransferase [Geodermatophilaceae bacterium]|nr:class I SAM-dependent methyltransferase [Geodermatophilaceae bacterium]